MVKQQMVMSKREFRREIQNVRQILREAEQATSDDERRMRLDEVSATALMISLEIEERIGAAFADQQEARRNLYKPR